VTNRRHNAKEMHINGQIIQQEPPQPEVREQYQESHDFATIIEASCRLLGAITQT
jgi:hypothetical protein